MIRQKWCIVQQEFAELSNEELAELAIDELVARSCEDMLTNSKKARELLSQLTPKQQKSLIGKLQETVQKIIDWADELLNEYKSTSEEAKILREHKDRLQELSKMWDAALAEAIKTNQSMKAGGVKVEGGGHIQHAGRTKTSVYTFDRKNAKMGRRARPTNFEWETAGHAIFAERQRRKQAGEELAFDGFVYSANHVFCYTSFSDDDMAPQIQRVERLQNDRLYKRINYYDQVRKENNRNNGSKGSGQNDNSDSGVSNEHGGTTGTSASIRREGRGINKGQSDKRSGEDFENDDGSRRNLSDGGLRNDFQMESTVEETPELIAVHNMTVKDLNDTPKMVYRSTEINPFISCEVGEYLSFDQFVSTSVRSNTSFKKPVRMVIYVPKGTKGVSYIEKISKMPKQRELLFDKDHMYKVLSNSKDLIELEVL